MYHLSLSSFSFTIIPWLTLGCLGLNALLYICFSVYQVKYALVEAIDGGAIFEDSEIYAHVNFYAKAKNGPKKHDGKVLVFAELHQVGRRLNAMVLLASASWMKATNYVCIFTS